MAQDQPVEAATVEQEARVDQKAKDAAATQKAIEQSDAEPAENSEPEDTTAAEEQPAEAEAETESEDAADSTAESSEPPEEATPSDGETPAPEKPSEPEEKSDTPEEPPKKGLAKIFGNKKIKLAIMILIALLLILGIGFLVRKFILKKPAPTQTSQNQPTAEASASPDSSSSPLSCISGYVPFNSKQFSICYPVSMSLTDPEATSSATPAKEITFEDDAEVLTVDSDYKDNLNKFNCVSSKVVDVSGYSAVLYTIKDYSRTDGCLKTIASYGLVVSSGDNKPVYYIGLSKKDGSYESDNGEFGIIQNSFVLNQ